MPKKDCIGCRITGTLTGLGLMIYVGRHAMIHRSPIMCVFSAGCGAIGIYRAFLPTNDTAKITTSVLSA